MSDSNKNKNKRVSKSKKDLDNNPLQFYENLLEEDDKSADKLTEKLEETLVENVTVQLSKEEEVLEKLRQLLFGDEIEKTKQIDQKLNNVKGEVNDIKEVTALNTDGFEKSLEPHLRNQLTFIKENFSDLFGDLIANSIQVQIKDNKNVMVEAMYPLLGAMLKKAIFKEFKLLNERLERRANQVFTLSFWKAKARGLLTGVDHTEIFLQDMYQSKIEDIFIIQKGSGMLIGKFKLEDTMGDRDVIAGALEAIKGFAESALGKKSIELEKVDYGDYVILLHNYHTFYFAVMCSGIVGNHFVQGINNKIIDYSIQHLQDIPKQITNKVFKDNSEKLQKYF